MRDTMHSRHIKLINYLQEHRDAKVQDLSDLLKVSPLTIRRDLEQLKSKEMLERYHGGVRKVNLSNGLAAKSGFFFKETVMVEEKQRIGEKAAEFVHNDDMIYMNGGTTVLYFMSSLKGKKVTIVTNNAAALHCKRDEDVTLLMLGGEYQERSESFVGEITVNTINNIYSSCAILGVNALSLDRGMTTSIYQECSINDAMISHCNGKVIVLADHTKMGKIANFVSASLSKIDIVITDDQCPDVYIKGLKENGIEVIMV
jgi:DeoR family fructose operon transcriptional repressor